jgi:mannose-6-phosphate isomerase
MIGPLLFRPLYQPRVWGGRGLAPAFGRTLPPEQKIGESWEIVDRPREQSVVARGPHAGRTLREMMTQHGAAIMGNAWPANCPFPILVKWLDCQERLSLQVHPPADVATELGGEPKTENWYIARAEPHASLIVGLRRGATRAAFERALADNTLEQLVHRFPVRAGDSMFVRSGRIHAIDGGNLILEIQQNSDTTYRVYDWGRMGDDGKPRQLHVKESLRCIDFNDFEPSVLRPAPEEGDVVLAGCAEFRIQRCVRPAGEYLLRASAPPEPRMVHVIDGAVTATWGGATERFASGENVLLPADTPCDLRADQRSTALLTDRFARR